MNKGYFCHHCGLLFVLDEASRCIACDGIFLEIIEANDIEEMVGYQYLVGQGENRDVSATEGNGAEGNDLFHGNFPLIQMDQNRVDMEEGCSFCHQRYHLGENVRQNSCGHLAHEHCLVENNLNICPDCAQTSDDDSIDENEDDDANVNNWDSDSDDGNVIVSMEDFPLIEINETHVFQEAECTVCLHHFILAEQVRELPCGHKFHEQCLSEWIEIRANCPTCRHRIGKQVIEEGDDDSDDNIEENGDGDDDQ